jgi:hypothetical protein
VNERIKVASDKTIYGITFLLSDCCEGGSSDHVDSQRIDPADVPKNGKKKTKITFIERFHSFLRE